MKRTILLFSLFAGSMLCQTATAQVAARINIASQPVWGPVGYDQVMYYYLPDLEMYYNVQRRKFYYLENDNWLSKSSLPSSYKNYDMFITRKVVVNVSRPYLDHAFYRVKYEISNGPSNQLSIRDSQDSKYFVNRNHPQHFQLKNARKKLRQTQPQIITEDTPFN
jgi:hypothetical protein